MKKIKTPSGKTAAPNHAGSGAWLVVMVIFLMASYTADASLHPQYYNPLYNPHPFWIVCGIIVWCCGAAGIWRWQNRTGIAMFWALVNCAGFGLILTGFMSFF